MRVCLTIDTEFSIAGAFADPALRPVGAQMVRCDVDGRSQGLDFMLDCFARNGITATFFIETLQRHYFRDDPMRPLAQRIAAAGHELQLHAHPCWAVFQHDDWPERVRAQPRQDDFAGRDEASTLELLRQGQATFREWGLAPPRVFRSASLQHDAGLYRALASAGIPYSSNIGLAIYDSGDPRYRLYGGRHLRHGVLECPVLTFSDWRLRRPHLKTLSISGTSFAETRTLLQRARRAGMELVVILTHPFEYVQSRGADYRTLRRHGVNQRRLERLCAYLAANADRYQASGLAAAASQPLAPLPEDNRLLRVAPWQSAVRMATQVVYDRYGHWALARQGAGAA
ncbi:peptidoglycan/xylan/chitin deacetylase (PgdA/CDA1 family) [Duganella sp. 1411]|uniref:polysaccharide deacetylase family protein n=1 Tax=Duganella sp. 1411 TaxID=2806572 RepID=UPI001AE114CC|nr:polysaccharide deacetylase family protein [Duganella sp. 1411]MBP1202251.1 peptidoglycan/xylan/chitin deacetylase (PgdA/CDA1 family) [Duganella sp. 1411]